MTYTSLKSPENTDYLYDLNIAHLYGNLMNTYGDNGNVLMLKYVAEKLGARVTVDIVSLNDAFDQDYYDLVFLVVDKTMSKPSLLRICLAKSCFSGLYR